MLSVCPHCLSRVLVKADGTCPSCGSAITPEDAARLEGFTIQQVDEGTALPGTCFLCDGPGTRAVRYHVAPNGSKVEATDAHSRAKERKRALAKFALFVTGGIFGRMMFSLVDPRKDSGLDVILPACDRCFSRARSLKPVDVNYGNRSMAFLVHRDFPRRLVEARGSGGAPGD